MSLHDRFPDAIDERERPVCDMWSPMLGPCICGDPKNHESGGKFATP